MNPVKLPLNLEAKTIAMMIPGETLYTVPWAMVVDRERFCWLRGDYSIDDSPHGTANMEIHRNAQGFNITLHDDFRYSLQCLSTTTHDEWELQPVTALSGC